MQALINRLEKSNKYKKLLGALSSGEYPAQIWGMADGQRALYCYAICSKLQKKPVFIVADEKQSATLLNSLSAFYAHQDVLQFHVRDFVFRNIENSSLSEQAKRINVLNRLLKEDYEALIVTADAISQHIVPKQQFLSHSRTITMDSVINTEEITHFLSESGYERYDLTEGVGQFSVRGGIIDFFPPNTQNPIRIELFGDSVDSISCFDIFTQRRIDSMKKAVILPATEIVVNAQAREKIIKFLSSKREKSKQTELEITKLKENIHFSQIDKYMPVVYENEATILDYLSDNTMLIAMDMPNIKEQLGGYNWRVNEDIKVLLEDGCVFAKSGYTMDKYNVLQKLSQSPLLIINRLAQSENDLKPKYIDSLSSRQTLGFDGTMPLLIEDIKTALEKKHACVVLVGSLEYAKNLNEELRENGIKSAYTASLDSTLENAVYVSQNPGIDGFEDDDALLSVFCDRQVIKSGTKKSRHKAGEKIRSFSDISKGDYVVHSTYGIGIYDGISKMQIDNITKDFIKIKFAGTDVLYIPCAQLDLISKYIGADANINVKLSKLGSGEWKERKIRAKKSAASLAKYLIEVYSKRAAAKGYMFSPDNEWQKEFEARFEYEETDDQLRCISEIKKDMEKSQPMDRLLCGDVGFGKTEVALRAVFKCVLDSKQAAILVPTTILAWQHYNTIKTRMANYPVKIEMLSRYRTKKQQEEILKKVRRGEIDVLVGTHRIIQKDMQFKDLGLLVIDEEQRFGVAHKERMKEITKNIDVLTLSATPIPRTLNMALSGIRDMSIIEEPPQDRHPVMTYVCEQDNGIISDAIRRELNRGGQVYYLHNNTETISKIANKISLLVPDAKVGYAHGKMSESAISDVWQKLLDKEIDVLVCTTIIETGVDVPNVNTIIIEDADKLGLAQLHQIRGRVGRSYKRAYAYLMYRRGKTLSEEAAKRLSAIKEFAQFGSGLKIAMRDLEIRGAGNILGAEQHGHLQSVGYDMYIKLLEEAVADEKGEVSAACECIIDINVNAHIPEQYISSGAIRIEVYKKIAGIQYDEDIDDVLDELIDRFGEPGEEIMNLIKIAYIKACAAKKGICEIKQVEKNIVLYFEKTNLEQISDICQRNKGRVLFGAGAKPYITLRIKNAGTLLSELEEFVTNGI